MNGWQGQQQNSPYSQQQPWQQPAPGRGSWQDPRLATQAPYQANPPVAHTPISPIQTFNTPNSQNTATWGVKYNHGPPSFVTEPKPPLPPRPISTLSHGQSPATPSNVAPSWQTPAWQASHPPPPPPPPPSHFNPHPDPRYPGAPQWTQAAQSSPLVPSASQFQPPLQQHSSPTAPLPPPPLHPANAHPSAENGSLPPPPPPPRPCYETQAQSIQWQQQQQNDSHGVSSHTISNNNYQDIGQPYQNQTRRTPPLHQAWDGHDPQAPVSPETMPVVSWDNNNISAQPLNQQPENGTGPSALGAGGPSDWEHFQVGDAPPIEEESFTTANTWNQSPEPSVHHQYAELPATASNTGQKSPRHSIPSNFEPAVPASVSTHTPARDQSVSPEPKPGGLRRTGTIDGVIQAWSTDLVGEPSRKSSVSTLDRSRRDVPSSPKESPGKVFRQQTQQVAVGRIHDDERRNFDPETLSRTSRESTRHNSHSRPSILEKIIEVDPYADLAVESKASLARFVTMLRKEEAAPEDKKYKVFKAFVVKENRLRSILYGMEPEDFILPALPASTLIPAHPQSDPRANATTSPALAGTVLSDSDPSKERNQNLDPSSKLTVDTSPDSNEDSYVVINAQDESEYSPGGRPRITRPTRRTTLSHQVQKSLPVASSPSDYAPIVVDDTLDSKAPVKPPLLPNPISRPGTAPLAMRNTVIDEPIKFEPDRPAYLPFRYEEGPQRGSETMTVARPAYQGYSALRHQSEDSGRVMTQSTAVMASPLGKEVVTSPTGNAVRHDNEEAFMGLIREKSRAYRGGRQGSLRSGLLSQKASSPEPIDKQARMTNAVRKLIPSTMPQQGSKSSQTIEAEKVMSQYTDVFTWIPEFVVKWDRENKKTRAKQDGERHKRQEESENHIDELFNDHQIGYSDIGSLEADFKLAEARKKYDEDVQELESFTEGVFNHVMNRLKEEVGQLDAQYLLASERLESEANSGRQHLHGKDERASRSEATVIVLELYKKLQVRYQKMAEARYERERRRKMLELSVLYTNGDTAAVKKLEQEFSKAERQQTLLEARERDGRANKLMDTFDRAVVRGLGDNQQFVDEVVEKLQDVNTWLNSAADESKEKAVADLQQTLMPIEELLDYVASDSQRLLTLSNSADDLLNMADYEVSKAEARLANTSTENLKKLEEEKSKEDERIKAEVDTRMGSVAKGPAHASTMLKNILKRLADGPQHQDRVQKALEAAKLRNASRPPAVG